MRIQVRHVVVAASVLVGAIALAPRLEAAPPIAPVPLPVARTVKIAGFRTAPMGDYGSGGIGLLVDVENTSGAASGPIELHLTPPGGKEVTKSLALPSKATFTVPLNDVDGFGSACDVRRHTLTLSGDRAVQGPRVGVVQATCSVTSAVVNGLAEKAPDHEEALTKDTIWVATTKIVAPYACGAPMKLAVDLVNSTAKAQKGVVVALEDVDGKRVGSAVVDVPKGGSAMVHLNVTPKGLPGSARIVIDVPSGGANNGPWSPYSYFWVKFQRTCKVSGHME